MLVKTCYFRPQKGVGHAPTFLFEQMEMLVLEQVWRITEPLVTDEGMEIVDIDFRREGRGTILRFYLDREGGVSLDDLAPMSRRLGHVLDVHGVVPNNYTLEVSSPGVNRRLRQPSHFRRYVGKRVRVRSLARHEGRRSFVGPLRAVEPNGIAIEAADGVRFINFDDIAQANYEHEFAGGPLGGQGVRTKPR